MKYSEHLRSDDFTARTQFRTSGSKTFLSLHFRIALMAEGYALLIRKFNQFIPRVAPTTLTISFRFIKYLSVILFKLFFSTPVVAPEVCVLLGPEFRQFVPIILLTISENFIENCWIFVIYWVLFLPKISMWWKSVL